MSGEGELDFLGQTVLLEMISTISRTNEEARIRKKEFDLNNPQIRGLQVAFLTQKLEQLKARVASAHSLLEQIRKLTQQIDADREERYDAQRLKDLKRVQDLEETVTQMQCEYNLKVLRLQDLDYLISVEEEKNRELRGQNTQLMMDTVAERLRCPERTFGSVKAASQLAEERLGLLQFIEPSIAEQDEPEQHKYG